MFGGEVSGGAHTGGIKSSPDLAPLEGSSWDRRERFCLEGAYVVTKDGEDSLLSVYFFLTFIYFERE